MKAFVSAIFGNDGWVKLVETRWLRAKQHRREAEYDPKERDQVPMYVKSHVKPHVPLTIQDELPTHGLDQFGEINSYAIGIGQP